MILHHQQGLSYSVSSQTPDSLSFEDVCVDLLGPSSCLLATVDIGASKMQLPYQTSKLNWSQGCLLVGSDRVGFAPEEQDSVGSMGLGKLRLRDRKHGRILTSQRDKSSSLQTESGERISRCFTKGPNSPFSTWTNQERNLDHPSPHFQSLLLGTWYPLSGIYFTGSKKNI